MFEMTVGLNVTDNDVYDAYRRGMLPFLTKYGGRFRYDFTIAAELKSESKHPINRVFSLCFPDRSSRDAFFSDPDYKKVRAQFFDKSVSGRTTIGEYEL